MCCRLVPTSNPVPCPSDLPGLVGGSVERGRDVNARKDGGGVAATATSYKICYIDINIGEEREESQDELYAHFDKTGSINSRGVYYVRSIPTKRAPSSLTR